MNICDFRSDIFNILNGGFRYDMKIGDGISYKTILASQGHRNEKVQWQVAFYMDFLCQMWCCNEYFNSSGTVTIVEWTLDSTILLSSYYINIAQTNNKSICKKRILE
jgi:hypothetical protein